MSGQTISEKNLHEVDNENKTTQELENLVTANDQLLSFRTDSYQESIPTSKVISFVN